jgi:tRNA(Ile)-lysidine synthase
VTIDPAGEITLGARASRSLLKKGGPDARGVLGTALLCAAGSGRPPRRDCLDRLLERIATGEPFTATLAGSRVQSEGHVLTIIREAGDIARAGGGASRLCVGEPVVWDGRFEITARTEGLAVARMAGLRARLDRSERAALSGLSPAARKSVPAIVDGEGRVSAPLLVPDGRASLRSLIADRFLAACGAVVKEADARLRSENATDTLNRISIPVRRVHEPA